MDTTEVNEKLARFLGVNGYEPIDDGDHSWRRVAQAHNQSTAVFYVCDLCGVVKKVYLDGSAQILYFSDYNDRVGKIDKPSCDRLLRESKPKDIVHNQELLATVLANVIDELNTVRKISGMG